MLNQSILNYEVEMIDYHSDGLSKPNISANYQYTVWQLPDKIYQIMPHISHTVRWIGNGENSYLDSFVYMLLSFSLKNNDLIMRLKEKLYDLSKKYLSKQNQKLLVQFLCLIQYSQDKHSFLRKYPNVAKMFVELFKSYENNILRGEYLQQSEHFTAESPIRIKRRQAYALFCKNFNFITVSNPDQSSYKFMCNQEVLYLVIQKECCFIVQRNDSPVKTQRKNSSKQQVKNSTPRFYPLNNTFNKKKSDTKGHRNHLIHQNNKSETFIQMVRENKSSKGSQVEDKMKTKKYINIIKQSPHKKLEFDQIKTKQAIKLKPSKTQTIVHSVNSKQDSMIRKLRQSQQKRQQLWQKLQKQYYQRKRQISKNIRQKKNIKHKQSEQKLFQTILHQNSRSQKSRKKSFNSYSALSILDHIDSQFSESQFDIKSVSKSQQASSRTILKQHNKRVDLPCPPEEKVHTKTKNRLSIIHQENRLRFWNNISKGIKKRYLKIKSVEASNRETIEPNMAVTFNYVDKNGQSYSNQNTPNTYFHKVNYCGSPERV